MLARRRSRGESTSLVIAADTVVESPSGEILEKPADAASATAMLRSLSGRTHRVHTGVTLVWPSPARQGASGLAKRRFSCTTEVTFSALPDKVVAAYVASGEPYDKAGGSAARCPSCRAVRSGARSAQRSRATLHLGTVSKAPPAPLSSESRGAITTSWACP